EDDDRKRKFYYRTDSISSSGNSEGNILSSDWKPPYYGKVCIFRGKEMICKDPSETSTTATPTTVPSTTGTSLAESNSTESTATVGGGGCPQPKDPDYWTLKLEIRISKHMLERVQNLIRVVFYYLNF